MPLNFAGSQFGRDIECLRRFRRDIGFDADTLPIRLRDWIYRAGKRHLDREVIIYAVSRSKMCPSPGRFSDLSHPLIFSRAKMQLEVGILMRRVLV